MPARAHDAEDHAGWEDEAEAEDHQQDVGPEDAIEGIGRCRGAFGDFVMAAVGRYGRGQEEEREEDEAEGGGRGEGGS